MGHNEGDRLSAGLQRERFVNAWPFNARSEPARISEDPHVPWALDHCVRCMGRPEARFAVSDKDQPVHPTCTTNIVCKFSDLGVQ